MPELKAALVAKEWAGERLRPVYYLSGEELHGKAAALEVLKKHHDAGPFNYQEFRGESLDASELVSVCQTPPLFSPSRIVVVKRAEKLHAEARKRLAEYLQDPLPTTCLILLAEERKPERGEVLSTLAAAKGAAAVYWPLREAEALDWARGEARKAGVRLAEDAVQRLIEEIGTDLLLLDQELGKLFLMVKGKKGEVGVEDVLASLGYEQAESVFSLGRLIQLRDGKGAVALARELLDGGEEPLSLLSQVSWTISRQLKARRLAEAGVTGEEAFRALKVSSYYNKDFLALAARRGEAELMDALGACLETEARLKTGALSPRLELENLLLSACGTPGGEKTPAGSRGFSAEG